MELEHVLHPLEGDNMRIHMLTGVESKRETRKNSKI